MGAKGYLFFVPWALFVVIDRTDGSGVVLAAAAAAAGASALIVHAVRTRVDLFAPILLLVVFGAALLAQVLVSAATAAQLDPYARAMATALCGLIVIVSLWTRPVGGDHFRSITPPQEWATRDFRQLVRSTTLEWGVLLASFAALFAVAARGTTLARTICYWILPLLVGMAVLWVDGRRWRAYADRLRPSGSPELAEWGPLGRSAPYLIAVGNEPDPPSGAVYRLHPAGSTERGD